MADATYKRGDTAPPLLVRLTWHNGQAIDLAGATVVFTLRERTTRQTPVLRRPVVVAQAAQGLVRVDWQPGDLAEVGEYDGEFEVQLPTGQVVSVPSDRYLRIVVVPDLG